tara:strand:+ start:519 stop:1085 length:567 start_codon:yes stop_codon:yes gene_type:complete
MTNKNSVEIMFRGEEIGIWQESEIVRILYQFVKNPLRYKEYIDYPFDQLYQYLKDFLIDNSKSCYPHDILIDLMHKHIEIPLEVSKYFNRFDVLSAGVFSPKDFLGKGFIHLLSESSVEFIVWNRVWKSSDSILLWLVLDQYGTAIEIIDEYSNSVIKDSHTYSDEEKCFDKELENLKKEVFNIHLKQ